MIPICVRRKIVEAYQSEATVNRLIRLYRETGDVLSKVSRCGGKRKLDLDWLRRHAEANPSATRNERA